MGQPAISNFSAEPVLEALRPLRRLLRRATQPTRCTDEGKVYLGDGEPVMVFPVHGGGAESTARLRRFLREAGFSSHDWGLGVDNGPGEAGLKRCLRRLEEQVIDVFEGERRALTLLGWGLSGIYAREVAKRVSPLVRQVITLGTPFNIDAATDRPCPLLRALGGAPGRTDGAFWPRLRQRPPVPCTSIFSLTDGTVPWQMCVEAESPESENVRIAAASHLELAMHPQVLEAVTWRLAQPEGEWRPRDA